MRVVAYITSYDRPEMLRQVQEHLESNGVECFVYEDGVTHSHRGKKGFWKTWDDMLKHAKTNEADVYIFTQDDVLNIDVEKIKEINERNSKSIYVHHIINDGREECWVRQKPKQIDEETIEIGWMDCIWFSNRITLEYLGFKVGKVQDKWFDLHSSSGVGSQLTIRARMKKIPCYKPIKSLGYHGDHESVMHPEERKKNPLISK
jgi:hypothetical protein